MKVLRLPIGFCLLIVFAVETITGLATTNVSVSSRVGRQAEVRERIRRVEYGLLYPQQIKGDFSAKMNLAERMKHYKVPGVSVAVINNGVIEWAKGYGVRESGTDFPVTADTLFQAASISKPIAAMAALRLVQHGKLAFDEDVNKKLLSWKIPENEFTKTEKVTLRGLLTHNAGLSVSGFPGYPANTNPLPTVLQILNGSSPANTKPIRVIRTPGTQWSYSGGGITVMQQLLTDISGEPFPALMKEAVLNKIKMKSSTYEQPLPGVLHNKAAKAHDNKGEKVVGDWHVYPEMAAAGLWTTPSDVARFAVELQQSRAGKSRKVLSPKMAGQMLTKQSGGWGLGITVTGEGKAARFSHGGSNKGYRCTMIAYTETGQGAVVMTNSENGDGLIEEVTRSIAKEYGWADYLTPEKTFVELDSQIYGQYTGKYEDDISVIVEDGKLKIHYGGEEKNELFAESETKFFVREKPLEVAFVKDSSGRVAKMIFRFRGRDIPLKKL